LAANAAKELYVNENN